MNTLDRLLRACATGHGCKALINIKTLNSVNRDIRPDLARAIIELPAIHPRAKGRWLDMRCGAIHLLRCFAAGKINFLNMKMR
jgi:hypothetical protein